MKTLLALLALVAISAPSCYAGKIKDSEWKTGILLEQRSEDGSYVAGSKGNVQTYDYTDTYYRIDGGDMIYVAVRDIHLVWDKLLKLTTNAPIKYVVKGNHVYVLDENGKQHTLDLREKILKPKP